MCFYCKLVEGLNACNYYPLFCSSQVTPNLAWYCFRARLLNNTFTNKIYHFTDYDGDRETKFEIYLYKIFNLWVKIWNFFLLESIFQFLNAVANMLCENAFFNLPTAINEKNSKYRIYSRISREILDNFFWIFSQFDLYAGQKLLT